MTHLEACWARLKGLYATKKHLENVSIRQRPTFQTDINRLDAYIWDLEIVYANLNKEK